MGVDRRKFLKIAGVSSIVALGGASLLDLDTKARASHEEEGHHGAEDGHAHHEAAEEAQGVRLGIVIDVKKCNEHPECNKCIEACNYFHNVPHFPDPQHEIKWLWKENYENAFTDISTLHRYEPEEVEKAKVLLLCNHCEHPPCVRVCPTKATYKLPNGITAQDYHRCIGCRFCMAACPFGARSFNWLSPRLGLKGRKLNPRFPTRMRGVVEKCNFCVERLDEGKPIACAEACPYGAIKWGDLNDPNSEIRKILAKNYTIRRKPELGTSPVVFYII